MAEIEYAFGWTPSAPDIRDAQFAFQAAPEILAALPKHVDLAKGLSSPPWSPVWQQGPIGSCGPHSAAADIVFSGFRQERLITVPMPSRRFIYWVARSIMGTIESDSGVDNRSLVKGLHQFGWCDEDKDPYVPQNFRDRPSDEAFAQAATRKIDQYQQVDQNLETMKACLAGDDPFIFGFSVYSSALTKAVARTGDIPFPGLADSRAGGHDVLICGYDDDARVFLIRNSWGDWGRNGYGTVPYEYAMHPKLAGDFWTIKWPALPQPVPPVPVPVPPIPVPPAPASGHIIIDYDLATKHGEILYPDGVTWTARKV